MSASRRAIQSKTLALATSVSSSSTTANTSDMESVALMMAQDSAAIQILLEAIDNTLSRIAGDNDSSNGDSNDNRNGDHNGDHNGDRSASTTRAMLLDPSLSASTNVASAVNSGLATEVITSICMFIHRIYSFLLLLHE